jgi:hypothetical protein
LVDGPSRGLLTPCFARCTRCSAWVWIRQQSCRMCRCPCVVDPAKAGCFGE